MITGYSMPGVQAIQQQIVDYLNAPEVKALPVIRDRQFAVELLAGGESNVMTDLRHRNTVVNIPKKIWNIPRFWQIVVDRRNHVTI